jgi:DNA-binding HxlR family transcriptional regulator
LLAEPERYTPGISTKVLTERLRKLTTFGRLCRTEHPGLPARVEYDLTPLDTGLAGILAQLRELNAVVEKETPPKKPE